MNRREVLTGLLSTMTLGKTVMEAATIGPNDHPLPVTKPRATSGDSVEPNWTERLILTVGPEKADLVGTNEKAIQAAVDWVARFGAEQ